MMMLELVYYVVSWINNFPPKGGVSATMSPRTMFSGTVLYCNKHMKIEFGSYAQVHEENQPTNSLSPRTTGAIALGCTYNMQAGYKFMSLNTGKIIHRRNFTEIPLTYDVQNRVEEMAKKEKRPTKLYFLDRLEQEEPLPDDEITGVEDEDDQIATENDFEDESTATDDDSEDEMSQESDDDVDMDGNDEVVDDQSTGVDDHDADTLIASNCSGPAIQPTKETMYDYSLLPAHLPEPSPVITRYGMVSKPPTTYVPSFNNKKYSAAINSNVAAVDTIEYDTAMAHVFITVLEHNLHKYGLRKVLRVFGEQGHQAALKELEQLHLQYVFEPVKFCAMKPHERKME